MVKLGILILTLSMGGMAIASIPIVQHRFYYPDELTGDENIDSLLKSSKENEAVKVSKGVISQERVFVEYFCCSPVYTRNKVDYYYEREVFKELDKDGRLLWSMTPVNKERKTKARHYTYMCGHVDLIKQGDKRFALVEGISTGQFHVLNKFWNEVSFSQDKFNKEMSELRDKRLNYKVLAEFENMLFGTPNKHGSPRICAVRFSSGLEPYLPPRYTFDVENKEWDIWTVGFDFVNGEVEVLCVSKPIL